MKRRQAVGHAAGWLLVAVLLYASQWHRAHAGQPAHFHTQLTGIATLALLIALSVWGGMMLDRRFSDRGGRL